MEHQHSKSNKPVGNSFATHTSLSPQLPAYAQPGAAELLQMQRMMGNRAVMQMMKLSRPGSSQGVIQREEAEEAKPNPKLDSDLVKLRSRCEQYSNVFDSAFVAKFEKYVQYLAAGDEENGMPLLNEILAYMQQVKAFQIPADQYNSVDPSEADKFSENTNLWSKTESYMPNRKAAETGGVSLESSLAGFLFNDLDFGMNFKTSDLMQAQWKLVSQNFISNAKGTVHAHILMGMNKESVLFKTEAPVVREKLEKGEVTTVIVHFYHSDMDFNMDAYKTVTVTTVEEWDNVLKDTVPVIPLGEMKTKDGTKKIITKINTDGFIYKQIQELTRNAEKDRHKFKR